VNFSKIIFEYPEGWIDSDADPLALQHRRCLETIRSAARHLNLGFVTRTSLRMADFAQRFAPGDTLLISVHSVGVAENVVRLKESYLPGLYYFDRTGYSGWAELAFNIDLQQKTATVDLCAAEKFVAELKRHKLEINSSKYQQSESTAHGSLLGTDPYIFLPLQTSDDLVVTLAQVDQLALASALATVAEALEMKLCIKRHPLCRDRLVERTLVRLTKKHRCVWVSNASVNQLISGAKAVVTVNSGVGFEALVLGVPVTTAGRSDYAFVTNEITSVEDLYRNPTLIFEKDAEKIAKMLKYYVNDYCLQCDDVQKAVDLISMWMDKDFSRMDGIEDNCEHVLLDIQKYLATSESNRRRKIKRYNDFLVKYGRFYRLYEFMTRLVQRNRV